MEGDGQGDPAGEGEEHRAVMVREMESHRYLEAYHGRNDFVCGQFGQNFTVEGLFGGGVRIGGRYRNGGRDV
jgi:MOSC domain-containing protein YiiM